MEHVYKADYWQMVKEIAERCGQKELVEIANDHIEAINKHQEKLEKQLANL